MIKAVTKDKKIKMKSARNLLKTGRNATSLGRGLVLASFFFLSPGSAQQPEISSFVEIFVLHSWHKDMPWNAYFNKGFHQGLASFHSKYQIYEEFMDTSRFPEAIQKENLYQFLKAKYAAKPINVVVAESDSAVAFSQSYPTLFPNARRIAFQTGEDFSSGESVVQGSKDWMVRIVTDFRSAIAEMIRVADPQKLYVIADTRNQGHEKRLKSFQQSLAQVGNGIETEYFLNVPMTVLLSKVTDLPPKSAIFYLLVFDDGDGNALTPFEAARKLSQKANAPIFSHWDSLMGSGILGGYLLSGERVGTIAARAITAHVDQKTFSLGDSDAFGYYYDWDQLNRWSINQNLLQKHALIHNRPPDLWLVFKREIIILGLFSVALIISLFLFQRNRFFKRMNTELSRLSMTDSLTGLLNRRAVNSLVENEISRCKRTGNPVSFLILDLDHFKRINDQYGHNVGDIILSTVAGKLQNTIRRTDSLARWGGEEFVILAVDSDIHQALLLSEKIRETVQAIPFENKINLTVSIGVAEYQPDETFDHFCCRADAALYRAKGEGRNRIVMDTQAASIENALNPCGE